MALQHFTFIVSLCLVLQSCSYPDKRKDEIKKLLGVWELDSISSPSGNFYKAESETKILIFKNETDYSYEWRHGDVGNTFSGKYFVLDNPRRGLKTLSFIPDIILNNKDSIRVAYMVFDIVNVNLERLQVVDKTEFIKRDNLPPALFNKNYIYRKRK